MSHYFRVTIAADYKLCSAMATMGIPISSSLGLKAKVVIVNDERIISPSKTRLYRIHS